MPERHRFDISTTIVMIQEMGRRIQKRCGNLFFAVASGGKAAGGAEGLEGFCYRVEHTRLQAEQVEFAFALDADEAGSFEFLDVVGERGSGNGQRGARGGAVHGTAGFGDLFQQLEAARVGQRFKDCGAPGAGDARGSGWESWSHGARLPIGCMVSQRWFRCGGYTAAMLPIGSHPAWHPVFEILAYAAGYAVFRFLRSRQGDVIAESARWNVIAAAAVGALVGSRVLGLAEQWPAVVSAWKTGHFLALLIAPGGKTIVGGLLGGWLGVEAAKRVTEIRRRTGDLFALPLCVGIAVGRVGCLIAGLADDTYGKPTTLPWAVDFGDHIGRHPTQAYEILFLTLLGFVISRPARLPEGARFRIFLAAYLAWRVVIDFLKPQPLVAGMNVIQWACLAGLCVLGISSLMDWGAQEDAASA